MTTELARQPATLIHLYSGKTITTGMSIDEWHKYYEKIHRDDDVKTLKLGGVVFNKSSFDYAETIAVDSVEIYINSLSPAIKQAVLDRKDEMRKKVGRRFESIDQVKDWLVKKGHLSAQ